VLYLVGLLRTKQWIKNGLLFFPILFNVNAPHLLFTEPHLQHIGLVFIGFIIFNFASGASYIINDILDISRDVLHPIKKSRPIASGAIRPVWGGGLAISLIIGTIICAYLLDQIFALFLAFYLLLSLGYSIRFKHMFFLDIMFVASGYVLRFLAGASIIGFSSSVAMLLSIFLIAMYISLSKRRAEITLLGEKAAIHRPSLKMYSFKFIDGLMLILVPTIGLVYGYYLFGEQAYNHYSSITFIVFIMGILRYLYLTYNSILVGSPEDVFIRDRPLVVFLVFWVVAASMNPNIR